MVLYSKEAINNLSEILIGLMTWEKHPLSVEHAEKYVIEIRSVCDNLDKKSFHFNTKFSCHWNFGEKLYTYRRNRNTTWYIIYNLDSFGNVYIQKILSNHLAVDIDSI